MSKKVSNNKKTGYLQHDLGILALLGSIFFGAVFVANSPSELLLENIVMLLISFSAVMFAAYRFIIPSVVTAGMQIIVYTVHQLFLYYTKFFFFKQKTAYEI